MKIYVTKSSNWLLRGLLCSHVSIYCGIFNVVLLTIPAESVPNNCLEVELLGGCNLRAALKARQDNTQLLTAACSATDLLTCLQAQDIPQYKNTLPLMNRT